MDMILYHEVIQGERVQGTMFPAGVWGKAPKNVPLLISQVFVNEENFGRLSAGRKLERRDDVTHGTHALRRVAGAVFGTGRF